MDIFYSLCTLLSKIEASIKCIVQFFVKMDHIMLLVACFELKLSCPVATQSYPVATQNLKTVMEREK